MRLLDKVVDIVIGLRWLIVFLVVLVVVLKFVQ